MTPSVLTPFVPLSERSWAERDRGEEPGSAAGELETIYLSIYLYGCCPIPVPCFLTTLQSTKRHGVQAKRSHLYQYKYAKKHARKRVFVIVCCITALIYMNICWCYCMLYYCSDIWDSFVIVSCIVEYYIIVVASGLKWNWTLLWAPDTGHEQNHFMFVCV